MRVDTRDMISVSDAQSRGLSGLISDAELGRTPVIVRNSKPAAAIVSIAELNRIDDLEENLVLLVATLARTVTDSGVRHDLGDVAAELAVDLDDLGEEE